MMPDFDDILKKSLGSINDGYSSAYDTLTNTIDKVRAAVQKYAGERVALELKKVVENMSSTVFRLSLDTDINNVEAPTLDIAYFKLSPTGFPIEWGSYKKSLYRFEPYGKADNSEELQKYFSELLDNPDSIMIQAIGFAMRQQLG